MAAGPNRGSAVTYEQMANYVRDELAPIELHMTAHDAWHLEGEQRSAAERRSARRAALSQLIAAAALIVAALAVILHR